MPSSHSQYSQAALENAFQTFNQLSDQLADSYRALEQQVAHLNEELTTTNAARLHELTEKERLASRLSTLLQALPGGVIVLDGNGQVQEYNQAALDLLGEPLHAQTWASVIQRAFQPRSDDGHDVSLVDGRRVNISTCPMVNEPGQILLITDVTDVRSLQEKLNQRQRLAAMGEMAASLAHQIRTPLASAMLYASNMKREDLVEEDKRRFGEKILSRLAHLEHIVNDMLLYARSNTTGREEQFSMTDFLTELEHSLDAQLVNSHIEYQWIDETDDVAINANRQMLLSALMNLCVNAIQALAGKGKLCVTARKTDIQNIELLVCDNGPGICQSKLDNIFEPFFTTRSEGTGLGLAVVKAIIHAHKGEILVDTDSQSGTTFILRLPLISTISNTALDADSSNTLAVNVG